MERPITIKYSVFTVVGMMALAIYIFYITIPEGLYYFGGIIIFAIYLNLATSFKTGIFKENSVVFKYPFRPFKRFEKVEYHLIDCVFTGHGTYLDGNLIIIKYRHNNKMRKRALDYPSNNTWEDLSIFLKNKGVNVI